LGQTSRSKPNIRT